MVQWEEELSEWEWFIRSRRRGAVGPRLGLLAFRAAGHFVSESESRFFCGEGGENSVWGCDYSA